MWLRTLRRSSTIFAALIGILGLAVGFLACYFFVNPTTSSFSGDCIKNYPLINPAITCGDYDERSTVLHNIDSTIDNSVALYIKQGKADRVSVWVRDLTTLQSASTNENDQYAPASLLKVPLMIAYYKLAELEPSILDTKLTYQLSPDKGTTPEFPPDKLLTPGQQYTVKQLIEQMIVYSDNNAVDVLGANIDPTVLNNVFVDLGIVIPSNGQPTTYDFITAKTYGAIFRSLYNASYLNQEYSEKALDLLASTTFKGLEKSLPPGTTVADKFGERGYTNPDGTPARELHECGIIYKPGKPFVLCIMTAGSNEDSLLSIIEDISSLVYSQI